MLPAVGAHIHMMPARSGAAGYDVPTHPKVRSQRRGAVASSYSYTVSLVRELIGLQGRMLGLVYVLI